LGAALEGFNEEAIFPPDKIDPVDEVLSKIC
jgi:hypothetical protein